MSALRLEALSKTFGGVAALVDVSAAVPAGEIYAVIGPNGAGKTTLFNLISGIYRPSAGHIFLADHAIAGEPPHARARLGIARTFQTPQIFLNMSALENVMVGAHRHLRTGLFAAMTRLGGLGGAERACREEAAALMERLGLGRYVGSESGSLPYGALKRLEVARAMASRPRLLLLDEPAAGLNGAEAEDMMRMLSGIATAGITIVLIEHNMRMVMGISQRVLVLVSGRVLVEGTPAEVQRNPQVVEAYLGADAAAARERRRA